MRWQALAGLGAALALTCGANLAAHATSASSYLDGVLAAEKAIDAASSPEDVNAARAAADILRQTTGDSQPEILDDLDSRPPRLASARSRLSALERSLENPADTSDPGGAKMRLDHIMAEPRYSGIQTQPSYWDQFVHWLVQVLFEILNLIQQLLASTGAGNLPPIFWYAVLVVAAVSIIALLIWALRSPRRQRPPEGSKDGGSAAARTFAQDQFGLADRLAAEGDFAGAIRALARAVATRLSGEPYWDTSPLTVRELFAGSAPAAGSLQPVLIPFEASVYGHLAPDRTAYDRAAAAAAPLRKLGTSVAGSSEEATEG